MVRGALLQVAGERYGPDAGGRRELSDVFDLLLLLQVKIPQPGLSRRGCALMSCPPKGLTDARCQPPVGRISIAPGQETSALISQWRDFLCSGAAIHGSHSLGCWENKKMALCRGEGGEAVKGCDRVELSFEMMLWTRWILEEIVASVIGTGKENEATEEVI